MCAKELKMKRVGREKLADKILKASNAPFLFGFITALLNGFYIFMRRTESRKEGFK